MQGFCECRCSSQPKNICSILIDDFQLLHASIFIFVPYHVVQRRDIQRIKFRVRWTSPFPSPRAIRATGKGCPAETAATCARYVKPVALRIRSGRFAKLRGFSAALPSETRFVTSQGRPRGPCKPASFSHGWRLL